MWNLSKDIDRSFRRDHGRVVETAQRIVGVFEQLQPEWLQPVSNRDIEASTSCGGLIIRDLFTFDVARTVIDELLANNVRFYPLRDERGLEAYGFGRDYTSQRTHFEMQNGIRSHTEEKLAAVYFAAIGKLPHLLARRYKMDQKGRDGFQMPHLDEEVDGVTALVGTGPGVTRFDNELFDPRRDDRDERYGQALTAIGTTDLDTGPGDIAFFDGTRYFHAGMRLAAIDPRSKAPREIFAMNSSN